MKSKRKDVLVKNVGGGPTLFQSPGDKTPKFMDLARAGFKGQGTSGNPVGVGGRIAGLAGMAGKGLAALQTVNQVAQQAQGGNPLGAALGAGYAFEANDPTGKRTANMIQGQAPPTPSVEEQRANVPQIPLPYSVQDTESQPDNFGGMASSSYEEAPQAPQAPVAVNQINGPTGGAAAAVEREKNRKDEYPPQPVQPMQPQPVQPQPMQQQPVQPQLGQQPMQQPMTQQPVADGTLNPYIQAPGQENVSMLQGNGTPVVAPGQENLHMLDPMASFSQGQEERYNLDPSDPRYLAPGQTTAAMRFANDSKLASAEFFASTLMEKLGADTVYKMNPHQIAMVSAYTFLKLS